MSPLLLNSYFLKFQILHFSVLIYLIIDSSCLTFSILSCILSFSCTLTIEFLAANFSISNTCGSVFFFFLNYYTVLPLCLCRYYFIVWQIVCIEEPQKFHGKGFPFISLGSQVPQLISSIQLEIELDQRPVTNLVRFNLLLVCSCSQILEVQISALEEMVLTFGTLQLSPLSFLVRSTSKLGKCLEGETSHVFEAKPLPGSSVQFKEISVFLLEVFVLAALFLVQPQNYENIT